MAAKTWFCTNNILDSVHQEMSETSPGADATSSPNYGWTVGQVAAGNYSPADAGTEQGTGTFGATIQPDGSINTGANAGDCWRTTNKYTGTFDTGTWTFQLAVIAVSLGGAQDGNAGFRLFRSANADGSGATEITSGRLEGGAVTNLAQSTQQTSVHNSTSINSFSLNDEYLFVQIGWEITGAGGMASADVIVRIGSTASLVTSPNFTATTPKTLSVTEIATATLALLATFLRTVAATAVGAATLARVATFPRALAATAGSIASLVAVQLKIVTAAATAGSTATMVGVLTFARTLAASAVSSATLQQLATYARTVAGSSSPIATLARALTYVRALAGTAVVAATLAATTTRQSTHAALAVSAATLSLVVIAEGPTTGKRLTQTLSAANVLATQAVGHARVDHSVGNIQLTQTVRRDRNTSQTIEGGT